jgi:hypothetical protein
MKKTLLAMVMAAAMMPLVFAAPAPQSSTSTTAKKHKKAKKAKKAKAEKK